jgi:hypothetical protein
MHRKPPRPGPVAAVFFHPAQNIFCNTQKILRYPFLFLNRFHGSESYRVFPVRYRYFLFVGIMAIFWNRNYFPGEIFKFSGQIRHLGAPGTRLQSI